MKSCFDASNYTMCTEYLLRICQSFGIQPLRPTGCAEGDHRWSDRWVTDKYRILETQSNNSWRGSETGNSARYYITVPSRRFSLRKA
ncbi:hypothetical protein CEXT_252091 [Caerostris extrusa]|uniref:Uncharacterized protein n=1 Tax=Caerostris extrusa TaxID=172846 RepID=A0AAV4SQV7_CAEEX|nr:hypothetical protein CEXT_252091 [Caerostris extrusa]